MRMIPSRLLPVALALTAVLAEAQSPRLTPVRQRITDAAIARDLELFRSLEERAAAALRGATGTGRYLAQRALSHLQLAREAYERNDRSAFPEDMIALAMRDLEVMTQGGAVPEGVLSQVVFPDRVRVFDMETVGRAAALRRDTDHLGAPGEVALAEAVLLRAGHAVLAGPVCLADSVASREANDRLRAAEATRVPVPTPAPPPAVVEERPPPVPAPVAVPAPSSCGPERLDAVARAVHFALDRHTLAPASRAVLDRTIARLREHPAVRVRLSGHTDPRASQAYNLALSQRRVDAVANYLQQAGIAADRIVRATAEGEDRPLGQGTGVRDLARERRVELVYLLCDGRELVPEETLDDLQIERRRRPGTP